MISLTENEGRVINYLVRNFNKKSSIREIARKLIVSHTGIQKILKKFEKQDILKSERIGTGVFYKINFNNNVAIKISELVLTQKKLNSYAKIYAKDLEELKKHSKAYVMYGSILTKGEKARDIDVMVIISKKDLNITEKICGNISNIRPKKIHLIVQTETDFKKNIQNQDKNILDLIKTGAVLWGENCIIKGIKNGTD